MLGSMISDRPSKPQMGVSIASYDGGNGEEMDVDFDGRFAAEDDGECGLWKEEAKGEDGRHYKTTGKDRGFEHIRITNGVIVELLHALFEIPPKQDDFMPTSR